MMAFSTTNTYAYEDEATTKFGITVGTKGDLFTNQVVLGSGYAIPCSLFGEYKLADWFGMRLSAVYSSAVGFGSVLQKGSNFEWSRGYFQQEAFDKIKSIREGGSVLKHNEGYLNLHLLKFPLALRFYPGK